MSGLRNFLRKIGYKQFKSPDELWRKRSRWGEINEFFGRQIFASDDAAYKLPLMSNPLRERAEEQKWINLPTLDYEYDTDAKKERANKLFEYIYGVVEKRISKDAVILDVGANTGYQLENFHKKGFTNLWGIDPQKAAVKYARETRPFLNLVEGRFGLKEHDVECDLLVCFGSILRIPYRYRIFDAIDRCANKYVLWWVQEGADDFNRDPHVGLAKKGFICIEKHVLTDDTYIPIGLEGADGPMLELSDKNLGAAPTKRNYNSFFLFRRIEPRGNAPKVQSPVGLK